MAIPPHDNLDGPLVSVVVPTYHHAPFIAQCLDSLLGQETTFPIEILVGEDESTDGTREICQRYAAEHPDRIRLFLRSRKDVMYVMGKPTGRANLMALIREARGEYIALCEGDDFWTDTAKLQKQVELLERNPDCAGSYHFTKMVDSTGQDSGRLMRDHIPERMDPTDTIGKLAPFHFSSFVFRSSTCKAAILGMPLKHTVSLDMGIFTVAAAHGCLLNAGGVMSAYRKHDGGITRTALHTSTTYHQNRILLWLELDRYLGFTYTRCCQEVMAHHWQRILWHSTPRARFRFLWAQIRAVPGWFLRHPSVLLRRLRDVVRG